MWKAAVGHDVSVKVEAQGDDWDTDPDFVNDISEKEQRWGAKTIEGSGRAEHIDIHQLRNKVSEEHEVTKKKELETGPKASYGYGGKFGTERDRMDKCAVGHEYIADVGKHSSQIDAAQGFGGKYGVQRDRTDKSALGFEYKDYSRGFGGRYGLERDKVDKAAVGFDYKSQAEKHDSQKDYSVGFGGKFGVQRDRQDKSALGWDHQEEVQPHASQTDYAKGFGGRYGIQKDRVDKSAAGFSEMAAPTSCYEKTRPLEAGASSGTSSLRSRFENMAKTAAEERRQAEGDRVRRQGQECLAARWKEVPQREKDRTEAASATMPARVPRSADQDRPVSQEGVPRQETKKKDEETSPTLPPRPVDLGEELCRNPSQDQPIYSESLVAGGDYEELPEPSDYCDSTSGGADYEELPAPLGRDAIYDHGGEGGEDYENILPEEPSQSQLLVAEMDNVYDVENPGTCAVALYDYQGDGDDEIYFDADDIITHIEMVDEGWWQGQCHGKIGLFPANYVRLLQ
ncbi:hematopoietic lineage cell-specific protein isoform X3 [Lathamus discolor]|uniref:hematopoietic lineage cell-specific protein isoform X3 n=1 Tax=Lathamus discolor TaxID=678569 RepID=UPI0032B8324F